MRNVWNEDPLLFVKFIFFTRDITFQMLKFIKENFENTDNLNLKI